MGCGFFKSKIQNKSIKQSHFLHVDRNSQKIKLIKSIFGCTWSEIGVTNLVSGPKIWLFLKNEQIELTDFLHTGRNFMQIERWLKIFGVSMVKNGCGQSLDRALKLTVSEEWTDGIKWFFACWHIHKNWKLNKKLFWVGMVKSEYVHFDHGTLKLILSQKLTDGINWFFYIFDSGSEVFTRISS